MTLDAIIVLITIGFILVSLYTELMGPAFTFLVAIIALGFFGILKPSEILAGFANEQIMIIIMLLLLGDIIRRTAIIEYFFDRLFTGARSYKGFYTRMMVIIGGFSAFLNNTPLVALMMPYVNNWCKKNNFSPSKFLMPLSFAAILGGCATLIGTSTNLIVNGMFIDQKDPGVIEFFRQFNLVEEGTNHVMSLHLFDFAWVGIPMMIIGMLYLLLVGEKLLPSKVPLGADISHNSAQYVFETHIRKGSHLNGQTIQQSTLDNIDGLYLFEILRGDERVIEVTPETILQEGDILFFTGNRDIITEVLDPKSGLTFSEVGAFHKKMHTEVVEVVVSQNSTLIKKTVKEINFRAKFDSTPLAIHRNGERVQGKIADIRLRAGDALLMLASPNITKRTSPIDFYFISRVKEIRKPEAYKVATLIGGMALAIILSALGFISFFMALAILLVIVLMFKIANPKDLSTSIDYNLAIIIALSLALGTAMIKTGVAEWIADLVIHVFQPTGKVGLLAGLYFITAILAAYATNKAAVAIIFPIAINTAMHYPEGPLNPIPFVLVVSFAAAANFMTPIGYQTNLMVYGPGQYSFKDFLIVGTPLTILYMAVTVIGLSMIYFW